jgi:hypothetical protein
MLYDWILDLNKMTRTLCRLGVARPMIKEQYLPRVVSRVIREHNNPRGPKDIQC